jgi:hypothetical protein
LDEAVLFFKKEGLALSLLAQPRSDTITGRLHAKMDFILTTVSHAHAIGSGGALP